jgi:flagellar protein FliS
MLYDEAVKQLDIALEMIASAKRKPNSIEKINKAVVKTQEIITELMASLDFEVGGEIAQNLFSLYNWFNRELLQSNITKDEVRIRAVRDMMNDLRSAWQEITAKSTAEAGRPSSGVNIAG